MTSPKAVARSFTHYAERRPALGLYIRRFAQIPSDRKPTGDARAGTDAMLHQKKWILPLLILRGYELPVVGAAYALTGRFNPATEERKYPYRPAVVETSENPGAVLRNRTDVLTTHPVSSSLTSAQRWRQYKARFTEVLQDARRCGIATSHKELAALLEDANRHGSFSLDASGGYWMSLPQKGEVVQVGVGFSNALDEGSDPKLAFTLQLAKIDKYLKMKTKRRESLADFEKDWALLERLRAVNLQRDSVQRVMWQNDPPELGGFSGSDSRGSSPSTF